MNARAFLSTYLIAPLYRLTTLFQLRAMHDELRACHYGMEATTVLIIEKLNSIRAEIVDREAARVIGAIFASAGWHDKKIFGRPAHRGRHDHASFARQSGAGMVGWPEIRAVHGA